MLRFAFALLLFACTDVYAAAVRGRVDFYFPNGIAPMMGAHVQLCFVGQGCMLYVTGTDGMYYFNATPGNHVVLVNGVQRMQFFIPNVPVYDIPPVRGN